MQKFLIRIPPSKITTMFSFTRFLHLYLLTNFISSHSTVPSNAPSIFFYIFITIKPLLTPCTSIFGLIFLPFSSSIFLIPTFPSFFLTTSFSSIVLFLIKILFPLITCTDCIFVLCYSISSTFFFHFFLILGVFHLNYYFFSFLPVDPSYFPCSLFFTLSFNASLFILVFSDCSFPILSATFSFFLVTLISISILSTHHLFIISIISLLPSTLLSNFSCLYAICTALSSISLTAFNTVHCSVALNCIFV